MPNWCMNELTVFGDNLEEFIQRAKGSNGEDFSLESFIPTVEDSNKWHLENWGTKWDVVNFFMIRSQKSVTYGFDSAWSPPERAILTISTMFPSLRFHLFYFEPSMVFLGELKISNGVIEEDVHLDGKEVIDYLLKNRQDLYNQFYGDSH